MDTRQARRTPDKAWVAYLVTGVVVVIAYYAAVRLGAPAVVRVALYCMVSVSAAVAVLSGVRNLPAGRIRLPWLFLGASQVVYACADICFYVAHNIFGDDAFPALADPLYLAHYPLVVVGLILLIRSRTPGRDQASLLDAATVAVAAAMLSWLYLIGPQARADMPSLAKIVSVAYPVMDLAMFAVALRLILGPGRRPVSFLLLAGNLLAIFTADTLYVMQQLNGTYQTGNFLDAVWLCGNLALGAAALHPTVARVADRASADDARLTRFRLVVLAGAALIAPATLLVQYSLGTLRDVPVIAAACAVLFMLAVARLAGLVADQRQLATTDVLTGLRTRRFFGTQLPNEIARARRVGTSLAVLIVDVDHFKSINDRYGHPAGDRVLVEVARRLRQSVRHADFIARYGGEEFALVLPEATLEAARAKVDLIRRTIEITTLDLPDDREPQRLTISAGVAVYPTDGNTIELLVAVADDRLLAAKRAGRNRVMITDEVEEPKA